MCLLNFYTFNNNYNYWELFINAIILTKYLRTGLGLTFKNDLILGFTKIRDQIWCLFMTMNPCFKECLTNA